SASCTQSFLICFSASSTLWLHSLSLVACLSYSSSKVSKYLAMNTTVGLSSLNSQPSRVFIRVIHIGRFLTRGGKYRIGVRQIGFSYIWHRYLRALRGNSLVGVLKPEPCGGN